MSSTFKELIHEAQVLGCDSFGGLMELSKLNIEAKSILFRLAAAAIREEKPCCAIEYVTGTPLAGLIPLYLAAALEESASSPFTSAVRDLVMCLVSGAILYTEHKANEAFKQGCQADHSDNSDTAQHKERLRFMEVKGSA